MQLFKTPNIKFLKYKYIALAATGIIVLAGILNITVFKGLKLGVDFGEGTLLRVMLKAPSTEAEIRDLLKSVGLGKSQVQKAGTTGREFQIRAVETVNVKTSQEDQLEAHEALASKIIEALRGDDGREEAARGLRDLNTVDAKTLSALLETSFPGSGPEAAQKVISYRTENGIIADFDALGGLGPP